MTTFDLMILSDWFYRKTNNKHMLKLLLRKQILVSYTLKKKHLKSWIALPKLD